MGGFRALKEVISVLVQRALRFGLGVPDEPCHQPPNLGIGVGEELGFRAFVAYPVNDLKPNAPSLNPGLRNSPQRMLSRCWAHCQRTGRWWGDPAGVGVQTLNPKPAGV